MPSFVFAFLIWTLSPTRFHPPSLSDHLLDVIFISLLAVGAKTGLLPEHAPQLPISSFGLAAPGGVGAGNFLQSKT
jgi:hypothetical protein